METVITYPSMITFYEGGDRLGFVFKTHETNDEMIGAAIDLIMDRQSNGDGCTHISMGDFRTAYSGLYGHHAAILIDMDKDVYDDGTAFHWRGGNVSALKEFKVMLG